MYDNLAAPLIGAQLRAMRQARGLTLRELAQRAGTSASALHRYESGWDRFEVATLQAIACGLGARVDIRLVAADRHKEKPAPGAVLHLLAPLFWDKPLSLSDLTEHPRWVLARDRKSVV